MNEAEFAELNRRRGRARTWKRWLSLGFVPPTLLLAVAIRAVASEGWGASMLFLLVLILFGLGGWLWSQARQREESLSLEVEFGKIDTYGDPEEWAELSGQHFERERFRHSPVTNRLIWAGTEYQERVYLKPRPVAAPPRSHENLLESGWLSETSGLHRELSKRELAELKMHYCHRHNQATAGLFGAVGLVALISYMVVVQDVRPLMVILMVTSAGLVPVGWRAFRQAKGLEVDLRLQRVVMFEESSDDGLPVAVEYLEGSGAVWTIQSAPAPWRGPVGAR